jgi:DNA-binding beta-propeller fold protein YncE
VEEASAALLFGETTRGIVDGTGRGARFDSVTCLELSPDGTTLYASDTFVGTVRKIDVATGAVQTAVGVAYENSVSDGSGDAVRAQEPRGLGLTPDGARLYFADGPVLRSFATDTGDVTSHAGIASEPGYTDGDLVEARLGFLNHDLEVTADGARVLLADRSNDVLRALATADDSVSTFATGFNGPGGLSRDGETLYVADTFAGAISVVNLGSGAVTNVAQGLDAPQGVAWDGADSLYALGFDGALRQVDIATGMLSTVATSETLSGSFASVVIDRGQGTLYFPDLDTSAIKAVNLADGVVSTLAGPVQPTGFIDGPVESARFGWIYSLVASSDGQKIYVADPDNSAVRVVDRSTGQVSRFTDAGWSQPAGVALDEASGRLYVSDAGADTVTSVDLADGTVSSFAEGLSTPWGIAVTDEAIFLAEYGSGEVSRHARADGARTVLGTGLTGALGLALDGEQVYVSDFDAGRIHNFAADGSGGAVLAEGLSGPSGIAVHDGGLYIAMTDDHTLQRIDVATGGAPAVVLGRSGVAASLGTDPVPASEVTFTSPEAVAVTADGLLVSVEYGAYLVPFEAVR